MNQNIENDLNIVENDLKVKSYYIVSDISKPNLPFKRIISEQMVYELYKKLLKKHEEIIPYDEPCFDRYTTYFDVWLERYIVKNGSYILTCNEWNYLFLIYLEFLGPTVTEKIVSDFTEISIEEILESDFFKKHIRLFLT